MWKLGKRPELDGLRGVAILLVILEHLHVPGFRAAGIVGVTLFFVLSGFLISSLLLEEGRDRGRVNLRAFYARRALRLLPALIFVVVASVAYELVVGETTHLGTAIAATAGYASNWVVAHDGSAPGSLGILSQTWSLSVEEQFYLTWPLLLVVVWPVGSARRWRGAFTFAVGGAAVATAERVLLWSHGASPARVLYGTDVAAAGLLAGCALALWLTSGRALRTGRLIGVAGFALLLFASIGRGGSRGMFLLAPIGAVFASVLLLAYLATPGRGTMLRLQPLRATGRISYGLYLWHSPILWALRPRLHMLPPVVDALICVSLAFLAAAVSYRFIEQPFLRAKARLSADVPVVARVAVTPA